MWNCVPCHEPTRPRTQDGGWVNRVTTFPEIRAMISSQIDGNDKSKQFASASEFAEEKEEKEKQQIKKNYFIIIVLWWLHRTTNERWRERKKDTIATHISVSIFPEPSQNLLLCQTLPIRGVWEWGGCCVLRLLVDGSHGNSNTKLGRPW